MAKAKAQTQEQAGTEPIQAQASSSDDILLRMTAVLESLATRQDSGQNEAIISKLSEAIERMSDGQLSGAKMVADATRKANRPSNEVVPQISAFNLRGDTDFPCPRLKCEMFLPWEAEPESLTREEIELLNLLEAGEFRVGRNDGSKVKITIKVVTKLDTEQPEKLLMNHDTAFNNDNHKTMPPLSNTLRQILAQTPKSAKAARAVLTMDEEAAYIEAGQLNDGSIPANGMVVSIGR